MTVCLNRSDFKPKNKTKKSQCGGVHRPHWPPEYELTVLAFIMLAALACETKLKQNKKIPLGTLCP